MPTLTLSFMGRELSVHPLAAGRTLIGSDPKCPLHIDSMAVAPRHAEIVLQTDRCRILALDANWPVLVNDRAVESAELSSGDQLLVGQHTLVYSTEDRPLAPVEKTPSEAPVETGQRQRAYLQILSGEHIGRIIPLNQSMIRLGKTGGDCAVIVYRDHRYHLSFLDGRVPSVNGVPLGNGSVALNTGSTIRIGDTELQFYS
jgi:pSer/pThr/pTyr-binding forkhead associated (FHA) protein